MINKKKMEINEKELRCLFKIFDRNGNDHIERSELKALLVALDESPSDSRIDCLVSIIILSLVMKLLIVK